MLKISQNVNLSLCNLTGDKHKFVVTVPLWQKDLEWHCVTKQLFLFKEWVRITPDMPGQKQLMDPVTSPSVLLLKIPFHLYTFNLPINKSMQHLGFVTIRV